MSRIRGSLLSISLLLVIIFTLLITSPVLADTETPPEATPVVEETPIPTEEVLPTEEATAEPSADPTEAAAEETGEPTAEAVLTGEEITPEQALVEVLAENELVLTDENGEAIPLASEAASDLAQGADPYFMVAGVYYGYTTTTCPAIVPVANCTVVGANPISAAINAYSTTYALTATGAIFLEAGTYNETASLNITTAPNITGLIGVGSSTTIINMAAGTNINIQNTIKGFTLQGLTINGAVDSSGGAALVDFYHNTGALTLTDVDVRNTNGNGDGIEITDQTGNVVMNKVESTDNGDEGAKITNSGNVTITNGEFDLNETVAGEAALNINSTGTVTLTGISVSENYAAGLVVHALKGVKITDSLIERNGKTVSNGGGVWITSGSAGTMTLTNVYADDNYGTNILIEEVNGVVTLTGIKASGSDAGQGLNIDTCLSPLGVCTNSVVGSVILKDVTVESNATSNIIVNASGAITVTDIDADSNGANSAGAFYNYEAKSPQAVTISNGQFTGNYYHNLIIYSKGNVTLNHVLASYSGTGNGIEIDNSFGIGSVTLLNTLGNNEVYGNEEIGLHINSKGSVTINQITASGNDYMGVSINNNGGTGSVTVKNAETGYCNEDNPGNAGIYIFSKGAVTLNTIWSSYGWGHGIWINNNTSSSTPAVSITNVYVENNDYAGLVVQSKGLITVTNLIGDYNNESDDTYGGVYLNNTSGSGGITINNSESNHSYSGWTLNSNGAVLINTISALSNDTYGLHIFNNTPVATSPTVTVKNGLIRLNGEGGLRIDSKGLISLNYLRVYNNNTTLGCTVDCNAVLDNTFGLGGVTITGTSALPNEFNNTRESSGLKIRTKGTVNLNYLVTGSNDLNGLDIINSGSGAVTIANIESKYNLLNGIVIFANGSITLNNPVVQYNTGPSGGVVLHNSSGTGSVTVQRYGANCWNYTGNCSIYGNDDGGGNGYGLFIASKGTVTVKNVDVYYHPQGNIYISNTDGTGSVVVSNAYANGSNATGLTVLTNGAVTLTDVSSYNNPAGGIFIDNDGVLGKAVSLTRVYASNSAAEGIIIYSGGTVTLAGIQSSNHTSTSSGLYVNNTAGTGGVTLTYSGSITNYFQNNTAYGVHLVTNGPIVINKTDCSNNALTNFYLNNPSSNGSVTMNTIYAYGSPNEFGIYIRTHGSVNLTGVGTYGNYWEELDVDNTGGTGSVTITNSTFDSSVTGHGILVNSHGAITLTNVSARWNYAGAGVNLNNSGAPTTAPGITVQNSGSLMNEINNNDYGLLILSKGPVKVVNTNLYTNEFGALDINNTSGATTASVSLTKVYATSSIGDAIYIRTKGAVTATTINGDGSASSYAVFIDNCQESGGVCQGAGNVTLTNVTGDYSGEGVHVYSNGAILVNNLTARSNNSGTLAEYGAYLDNHLSTTSAAISVKKAYVSGNSNSGIHIYTKGLATIDGIIAEYNNGNYYAGGAGVYIDNTLGTANVVVSAGTRASTFYWNYNGNGLHVITNGTITATKITSDSNGQSGLYLETLGTAKAISLNTITVRDNSHNGIDAHATAASTFTAIKAYNNGYGGYDGVLVDTGGNNAFTLINSYLSGNGYNGLDATVGTGTVNVKGCFYYGNGRYGSSDTANIDTHGSTLMIS